MKSVYHIERGINKLSDGRVYPKYKTAQVILPLFLGFMFRIKSMNELKFMLEENEFRNVVSRRMELPQIDTIRDTLKVIEAEGIKYILVHTVKKSIENKVFDNGTIDGYTVAAIDGTKLFGSYKKCCSECLTTIIKGQKYYYHYASVISLIGDGPKLILGFQECKPREDYTKDEGELIASKQLISDISRKFNSFVDVVVYDALACNSIWINLCLDLGADAVVRVKKNKNNSIRQVKREVNKKDPTEIWSDEKGFESVKVYEANFKMENVEQPLRFIKFTMKNCDKTRSQIMIVTTNMDMSLKTLFKMIRARWNIENCTFNNLKTECNLKHCYVHGGNSVEAILYLIFIANNLMQLFLIRRLKRRYQTQREMVRLMLKGLYLMRFKADLVFNTS
jgi:predicted transposase YbfD/YdcC